MVGWGKILNAKRTITLVIGMVDQKDITSYLFLEYFLMISFFIKIILTMASLK